MVKAVFFDMYGTLAGFSPSRYELQPQACADFRIEVTPEGTTKGYAAADAYMNEQNAVHPIRLRDNDGEARFFGEYDRLVLRGSGVEVTAEQALKVFRRLREIPYSLVPFNDVVPTLEQLRSRGLTLGLISNIDKGGSELADKPDPAIFQAALARAEAEAEEAVHVGDQPTSDVEGALAAGISPVLLDRDGNHGGYDRCPRIETLRELPPLLASY